jgi:Tetratricopeptide repeat
MVATRRPKACIDGRWKSNCGLWGRITLLRRVPRNGGRTCCRLEQRYPEAESLLRQVLVTCQRLLGNEHIDTLLSQYDLATVLKQKNRYEEAEALIRRLWNRKYACWMRATQTRRHLGRFSPTSCSENSAPSDVEEFARPPFDDQLRTLGPHHQDTLESLRIIGGRRSLNGEFYEGVAVAGPCERSREVRYRC